ncbi:MAG UNVERIFIED_CONTAM: LysE/ArgO family amino acid transporter [Rickettsiaceae bacterium]|jgi:L-lysine exporter family protein LysE/ArgO
MEFDITPFVSGFSTGLALIVAIGAQNAYVIKQGIIGNHPFYIALTCSVIDAILIALGVAGFGAIIASDIILFNIARYGGATFLIYYGLKSLLAIFKDNIMYFDKLKATKSLKSTIATVIALSLLNPHLYLDTCLLIGTIGANFGGMAKVNFALGAISASFFWFFALSYGSAFLAPLFQNPISWKILDFMIFVTMWSIAGFLIIGIE